MRKTRENEKKERKKEEKKKIGKRGIKKNPEYVREYEWKKYENRV